MKKEDKDIKVIVSDLDGTLLNSKHEITPFTKFIFGELHNQGYTIIIATGRHHLDAREIVNELSIPFYLVTSNGARIHCPNQELLFAHDIDSKVVQSVFNIEIDPSITAVIFKEKEWLTSKTNKKINSFQKNMAYPPRVVDYKQLQDFSAIKLFFTHNEHEVLVALKDEIIATHSELLTYAFSLPFCLEFMDKSIDKKEAIAKILDIESLTFENTIVFGDGFNDEKMLQAAGIGLIMDNAPRNLKSHLANLKVIDSNDHDAVANYLKKHLLVID